MHPDVMAESLQQLKVSELRDRLKGANLPTGGRKVSGIFSPSAVLSR